MNRDESLQIVEMILSHWRVRDWTREEIEAFAHSIQDLGAEITTSAVIRAAKELKYPPRIMELREYVQAERKRLAPQTAPLEPPEGRPLDFWVRRWVCARFLHDKFGKQQDMRRFVEQGDYGNLSMEVMPEGAWVQEAESVGEKDFHEAFAKMFRP